MIFKILGCGTSTGVPVPACKCEICTSNNPKNKRSRTSALIKVRENYNILIDASTDLRWQALAWNIESINAVLFTHAHADHILGIDDLRSYNFVQRSSIPCYGATDTLKEIKRCFSYIFDPVPGYEGGPPPQLTLFEVHDFQPFNVDTLRVQPFNLMHGKTPVTGFRFGELAYATDCNFMPDATKDILRNIKVLILDGLRHEPHKTHYTIDEAIALSKELGVEKTYLTHMTHTVEYDRVSRDLPENVFLAYDGLEIPF